MKNINVTKGFYKVKIYIKGNEGYGYDDPAEVFHLDYTSLVEDNHFYSNKSISIRNNTQGFFSEVKDNFFYCKKLISKYSDFENNFIREKDEDF